MLKSSGGLGRLALLLFCAAGSVGPASGQVKGTATYRERIALPPNAVFEATLEDVSKADAPAEVIGQTRIERPGNPPIRFEITYDPARIIPSHRYSVRARILVDGKLFFTTDQHYPVLTGGKGNEVALLLRRVGSSGSGWWGRWALGRVPGYLHRRFTLCRLPGYSPSLELFPDQTFFLRMTYLGKGGDANFDDIGGWTLASDRRTLVCHGGREAGAQVRHQGCQHVRKLDLEGHEITSSGNYDLKRTQDLQPLEPRLAHARNVQVHGRRRPVHASA